MTTRHFVPSLAQPVLAVIFVSLWLSACATTGGNEASPKQDTLPSFVTRTDDVARGDTDDVRVAQLWSSAERARSSGQGAAALNLIYEALELSPQNPMLWSRAAELQLDDLEAALAESYASKSNAFAREDDSTLRYRNWLIIEQARQMRGDLLGVRSAQKKVQEYQYR